MRKMKDEIYSLQSEVEELRGQREVDGNRLAEAESEVHLLKQKLLISTFREPSEVQRKKKSRRETWCGPAARKSMRMSFLPPLNSFSLKRQNLMSDTFKPDLSRWSEASDDTVFQSPTHDSIHSSSKSLAISEEDEKVVAPNQTLVKEIQGDLVHLQDILHQTNDSDAAHNYPEIVKKLEVENKQLKEKEIQDTATIAALKRENSRQMDKIESFKKAKDSIAEETVDEELKLENEELKEKLARLEFEKIAMEQATKETVIELQSENSQLTEQIAEIKEQRDEAALTAKLEAQLKGDSTESEREMQIQISEKEVELNEMKSKVTEYEEKITHLEEGNQKLRCEVQALESKLIEIDEEAKRRMEQAESVRRSSQGELKSFEDKIKLLQFENDEKDMMLTSETEEKEALKSRLSKRESEIQELSAQLQNGAGEIERELAEHKKKIVQLETQNNDILRRNQEKIDEVRASNEGELDLLNKQVESLKCERKQLMIQVERSRDNSEVENNNSDLLEKISVLEGKLAAQTSNTEKTVADFEALTHDYVDKLAAAEQTTSQAKMQVDELESRLQESSDQLTKKTKEFDNLKEDMEVFLQEKEYGSSTQDKMVAQLKNLNEELETKIQQLHHQNSELHLQIESMRASTSQGEEDMEKEQLHHNSALQTLQEENEQLRIKDQTMCKQLSERDNALEELKKQLDLAHQEAQNELSNLQNKFDEQLMEKVQEFQDGQKDTECSLKETEGQLSDALAESPS